MNQLTGYNNSSNIIFDLGKYLVLLKKNSLKIFAFSFLVTLIATIVVYSITPKFKATSTLLIESETRNAVSIEEVVGIDSSQKEYYLTQFEVLKSNRIAQRVIDRLSLSTLPEFNNELRQEKSFKDKIKEALNFGFNIEDGKETKDNTEKVRQKVLSIFRSNLTITPIRKTQLVKITFTSESPELAMEIANAVGEEYIKANLESRLAATKDASIWISNRLSELNEQLKASEKALTDYLVQEKLIDDSGISTLASSEILGLSDRLAEITDRRIELESAYNALKRGKDKDIAAISTIPIIANNSELVAIRQIQISTEAKITELSQRYGPKHDRLIQANAQLNLVKKQAENIIKKLIKGLGKELQTVKAQELLISKELNQKKEDFQSLSIKKLQYESYKREVDTNRKVLNLFLTRQKETTATSDFEAENARFTDKAMIPQLPSSPKKKIIIVMSFVMSIIFASVVVFLTDALRNTVESIKHFEELFGIIPLGGVPKVRNKKYRKQPLDNQIFFDEKQFGFSESIRSIRTSLLLTYMKDERKRIAITSSLPGEGKTTTSINLALSLSKMEKVLLIDCDLRKSSISERFGMMKYQQGISNHLSMGINLDECIFKDKKSNLSVLPAGMLSSSPQELLNSEAFSKMLDKLDRVYDRVIIDTPPVLAVSDALIISKLTGSIIMVIKANSTRINTIKNTIAQFVTHDIKVDGVVINSIDKKVAEADYVYGSYGVYSDDVNLSTS